LLLQLTHSYHKFKNNKKFYVTTALKSWNKIEN
jgi:hypothetical protein